MHMFGRFPGEPRRHQRFDAEARQQRAVARHIGIARGQQLLAVENGIRAGQETQRLQLVTHGFASGGEAQEDFVDQRRAGESKDPPALCP